MLTATAPTAPTALIADLTCNELTRASYIEGGRRKWEGRRAGDLIRMFAAGGYDVIKDRGEGSWTVHDQTGNIRAFILSHRDVPDYAYAFTCLV